MSCHYPPDLDHMTSLWPDSKQISSETGGYGWSTSLPWTWRESSSLERKQKFFCICLQSFRSAFKHFWSIFCLQCFLIFFRFFWVLWRQDAINKLNWNVLLWWGFTDCRITKYFCNPVLTFIKSHQLYFNNTQKPGFQQQSFLILDKASVSVDINPWTKFYLNIAAIIRSH